MVNFRSPAMGGTNPGFRRISVSSQVRPCRLVAADVTAGRGPTEDDLERVLQAARQKQDRLSEVEHRVRARERWPPASACLASRLARTAVEKVVTGRAPGGAGREHNLGTTGSPGAAGSVVMLVAFSITPLGVGTDVGAYVADAVKIVRASGLPNRTDAMFTTVEGDWDEVMDVIKLAMEAVAANAPRVSLVLKADLRPGITDALTAKVESVERYLRQ